MDISMLILSPKVANVQNVELLKKIRMGLTTTVYTKPIWI
jgi:hypothetical protein